LLKVLAALLACLLSELAFAAANPGSHGPSLSVFIAQIIVLLTTGRILGELMQRFGQPAVMGQLIAVILLGPAILSILWPGLQHPLFRQARSRRQ
jgi:hypothetical protein